MALFHRTDHLVNEDGDSINYWEGVLYAIHLYSNVYLVPVWVYLYSKTTNNNKLLVNWIPFIFDKSQ